MSEMRQPQGWAAAQRNPPAVQVGTACKRRVEQHLARIVVHAHHLHAPAGLKARVLRFAV